MTKLDKINFILLIISLSIWAFIYQSGQPEKLGHAIFSQTISDITEIKSTKNSRLQFSLKKDHQDWFMSHPHKEKAVRKRVKLLLALSKARSKLILDATKNDLQTFGFKPSSLKISFNQTDLTFGGISHPSLKRYILVEGNIYLIDDAYYRMAGLAATNYLKPLKEKN